MDARFYDSAMGRFRSLDPVNLSLGGTFSKELEKILENPQGLNSYSYGINNPIRYNDPDGEWHKEFLMGQQSWSDYRLEVGQATQELTSGNRVWDASVSNPYVAGPIVGVVGGAAAYGGAAVATSISTSSLGSAGTACIALCNQNGERLISQGVRNLHNLPRVASATQKMIERGRSVGINGVNQFINHAQRGTAYLDRTTGNINIFSQITDTNKYLRITLNPEANKIISAGLNSSRNVINGIANSRFVEIVNKLK